MLKRIATSEVRLGMYLHGMEGSWLQHPFWKTKFVLKDPDDLAALVGSGVPYCWINVALGVDAEVPPATRGDPNGGQNPAPAASLRGAASVDDQSAERRTDAGSRRDAQQPAARRADRVVRAPKPVSMRAELDRAAQVLSKSKQAVSQLFTDARLGRALDTQKCAPLVEDIADSVARNPSALVSLARLKTTDDYTYMHSVAVCALMVSLSRQLGQSESQAREAGLAGLLHDVGKMAMPLEVLNKPGALSEEEFSIMRAHPQRGFEILKEGSDVSPAALDVALNHHEKMDGTGYPAGLAGDQISLLARMGAVCDVYDAVTSLRPYKRPWDPALALARMAQWKGHFDPQVFQAFVKCVGIYPVGTLVKLSSGKLAVVVAQNAAALTAPQVRVFYSTKAGMPIPTQVIDLSDGGDRIASREDTNSWDSQMLEELWKTS